MRDLWRRAGLGLCLLLPLRAGGASMTEGFSSWLVPWDAPRSSAELECFDQLNPFALALSSEPAVVVAHPELLAAASGLRREGALLIPVVVNDVYADGKLQTLKSDRVLSVILSDPRRTEGHVAELVKLAADYDGIEIDYERIPAALWSRFADFIESLGRALHERGKRLYVDLEPKRFYKLDMARRHGERIARGADGINLMAYYERGGVALHPGAGSSLPWAVDTARWALEFIPRDKLVVALSLAGTDWRAALAGPASPWTAQRLHYGRVLDLLANSGARAQWDEASSCPYFRARIDGRRHEVWFEDERSLGEKIRALRGLGVERIGFWYWGARHPDVRTLGLCRH